MNCSRSITRSLPLFPGPLLALWASLLLPTAGYTADPVTVGATITASTIAVDDLIEKAGNEGNYVVFSAASELKLVIESARLAMKDAVDDALSELDDSQQRLFENIQQSLVALQTAVEQPIEQGRQTVEEVHQIVSQVMFDDPAVLRTEPSVVGPSTLREIPFTIRGISLDDADPQLFVGKTQARRIGLSKQQTTFSVAATSLPRDPLAPRLLTARLRLNVEQCTLFVFFCSTVPRDYEVAILSLPDRVASLSLDYSTKAEERIYEPAPRSRLFGYSTGDLTRMKCTKENQGPHAPGYFIDTDSVALQDYLVDCPFPARGFLSKLRAKQCPDGKLLKQAVTGRARNRWELLNKLPTGFTVELCAQSQMHTVIKKRNGEIAVNLAWREYKLDDVISSSKSHVKDHAFNWSSSYQETLPATTHAISLTLNYFDGSQAKFIGAGADKYVTVSWNNATKQLLVSAKRPKEINGIN